MPPFFSVYFLRLPSLPKLCQKQTLTSFRSFSLPQTEIEKHKKTFYFFLPFLQTNPKADSNQTEESEIEAIVNEEIESLC